MQDPAVGASPEVKQAVADARSPSEVDAAIVMVKNEHDDGKIQDALDKVAEKTAWYESKKFWYSLAGSVGVAILQGVTGGLGWPVTGGIVGAIIINAVLAQAGVDKAQAKAVGDTTAMFIQSKLAKK